MLINQRNVCLHPVALDESVNQYDEAYFRQRFSVYGVGFLTSVGSCFVSVPKVAYVGGTFECHDLNSKKAIVDGRSVCYCWTFQHMLYRH